MRYVIVKGNGSRRLNGFYDGDLPITGKVKFNDKTGRLENKFSNKQFSYSKNGHLFFDSMKQAGAYIDYIKRTITENYDRYESVLAGSAEKLMKHANDLKIIME